MRRIRSRTRLCNDLLKSWLCLSVLLLLQPSRIALADRAEELLGERKIEPPVRRAIDQDLNDPDARKAASGQELPGVGDPLTSIDPGVKLLLLLFRINQSLAIRLETADEAASAPAGGFNAKTRYKGLSAEQIAAIQRNLQQGPWREPSSALLNEAIKDPKETMLHLLKTVNEKLEKVFAQLDQPSDHAALQKAKLALSVAQEAVSAMKPAADVAKRKKPEIGKPMLPVSGGGERPEHFDKRVHAAVHGTPKVPQPRVSPPYLEPLDITKLEPTEEKIDQSVNQLTENGPKVDQHVSIDVDDLTEKVNQHIKESAPTIDDLKSLTPSVKKPDVSNLVDTDAIKKKAQVDTDGIRKKVTVDTDGVEKKISEDVDPKVDDINKSIDEQIADVDANVDRNIGQVKEQVDDISKNVEQQVGQDVDGIKKKVSESVDESGLEKSIEDRLSDKLKGDLEQVRKKCIDATNQAYAGVKKYLDNEISTQKEALIKKYRGWWWAGVDYDYWHGEPNNWPSWLGDDVKTYKKYYGARQQVELDQSGSIGNINTVFATAEANLAVANQGELPSSGGGGDDSSPNEPKRQQHRVPGAASDHEIIDIQGNFIENAIVPLEVVAAIGDESVALAELGTVGAEEDTRIQGSVRQTITAPGVITAALGYETDAFLRVGTIDANVNGPVTQKMTAPALIVAAIGGRSDAIANIGTVRGTISGPVTQEIVVPSSVVASIGGDTKAHLMVGNIADHVRVGGSVNQKITLRSPTIDAAIGYRSNAITTIGNVQANVGGSLDQTISVGGIVNAAIGSHTDSTVAIGDIYSPVSGNVKQNISTGEILSATIGAGTKAITEVGTIRAPVYGNVDMNIHTGSFIAASVGVHTVTEAYVGTIQAPVHGNLTSNIHTGHITNFAIGIGVGSGTEISAKTYVGNVFTPVKGNTNIDISTGNIFTFGFGLDIDLGPLGELRIIIDGCEGGGTSLGNIGGPC